jgi:hypothetical protein
MDGREWRVEERAEYDADDAKDRALVFSTEGETIRLGNYHWLWFGFTDEELVTLCRTRRPGGRPAALV